MASSLDVKAIEEGFKDIQNHICKFFVDVTEQNYLEDIWDYEKGSGGGITRIWEGKEGDVLEKAGVNYSGIIGPALPQSALAQLNIQGGHPFHASGVSLVIHPFNPHIPTIHMNIRYFESGDAWWFGGGVDLTPYYIEPGFVIAFHKAIKNVCDRNGHDYNFYKKTCDDYFTIKHRNEMRGVGGIFFDHLTTSDKQPKSKEELWNFIKDLGYSFIEFYRPFIQKKRQGLFYTEAQREFQLLRRARYTEFNLVYDRGTKFGLQSEGRIESILMSLPAVAKWKYNWKPAPGSEEEHLTNFFLKPQNWVQLNEQDISWREVEKKVAGKSLFYGLFATGLVAASLAIIQKKW